MVFRVRFELAFAAVVALAQGQNPADLFAKAPPGIDEALRERVAIFYQAHVDGKFRLADSVVAEESKDHFFAADKPRYRSFEILKIAYEDNFRKARVSVAVGSEFALQGTRMPVTVPLVSTWKVVDGKWFWYVADPGARETPFGTMRPGGGAGSFQMPSPAELLAQVKPDRSELMLSSFEKSSGRVEITNNLPGEVQLTLELDPALPGLKAVLDKTALPPREKAILSFSYEPPDTAAKPAVKALIRVEPTRQEIPILVQFAVPPEVQRQLPKL